MIEPELIRFFRFAWLILSISIIFPLYLRRDGIKKRSLLIKFILVAIVFGSLGILVQVFEEEITSSEIKIILFLLVFLIAYVVLPQIYSICQVVYRQTFDLKGSNVSKLLDESFDIIRAKNFTSSSNFNYEKLISTGFGLEFLLKVNITEGQKSVVKMRSYPIGNSIFRFRLLFLLASYPPIIALSNSSFSFTIPLFDRVVDSEISFFVLVAILFVFLSLQNTIQRNFFYEFEEIQKEILLNMVLGKTEDQDRKSLEFKKPSIDYNLSTAKQKASKLKDKKFAESLDDRKKQVQSRVDGIMGKHRMDKELDPELIKSQLLIAKITTVLSSTPIAMEVNLKDIAEKVNHKSTNEVESIIISLINRKEVKGSYDIWRSIYSAGDTNTQFIERTLQTMMGNSKDLEFIKMTKSGDVEIKFHKKLE